MINMPDDETLIDADDLDSLRQANDGFIVPLVHFLTGETNE